MSRVGFWAPVLLILLGAPLARAGGKETQERAARKACLSGDYTKGVEILSDLFIDTKDPTHIFNQGRCLEQNNRYEEALARFREYLRKATDLNPTDKADTEKHIVDCQAFLGNAQPAPAAPAPGPPSPATSSASLTPPPLPPTAALVEQTTPVSAIRQASHSEVGLRIAGITCGAVGLASVGAGIYFYTRARSSSDKVSKEQPVNPSDDQAGKNAETLQWVFYSVGGAALATGTVLYILGWPSTAGGGTVTGIAPLVGPGLAGMSAQGAF